MGNNDINNPGRGAPRSGQGGASPYRGGVNTRKTAAPAVAKPQAGGTRQRPGGGSFGPAAPAGNPLIDAMLGLLGGGGAGGGGGGGGGGYVPGYNGRAARQAAQQAYDAQLGDTRNVYGQITTSVKDRAPKITESYKQATDQINADAAARVAADQKRAAEADQRNMQTAAALGLNVAAPTGTRADEIQQAGQNAYQANAQAWGGFNQAAEKTALERNTATADAFTYAGTQAEQQLRGILEQALAQIAGQEAANPGRMVGGGGGRGGGGGGPSFNDQFKVLNALLGYDMDQQQLAAGQQKNASPLQSLSPSGWQAVAGAYGGGRVINSQQGNAAALTSLAQNPRDFATLFSTLYG